MKDGKMPGTLRAWTFLKVMYFEVSWSASLIRDATSWVLSKSCWLCNIYHLACRANWESKMAPFHLVKIGRYCACLSFLQTWEPVLHRCYCQKACFPYMDILGWTFSSAWYAMPDWSPIQSPPSALPPQLVVVIRQRTRAAKAINKR